MSHASQGYNAVAAANYDPGVTGQAVAELVLGYAVRDGWNCLGDRDALGACTANGRPFKDTTGYEPTLQAASAWAKAAYRVSNTSPWCATCTQSGTNCFTGGHSCQKNYGARFCRRNMVRPPCPVSACGDRSMIIFPRRPARCAPETNPAVGARTSARLPLSLPHDHVHMPPFWHLTIISSSLPPRRSFLFV